MNAIPSGLLILGQAKFNCALRGDRLRWLCHANSVPGDACHLSQSLEWLFEMVQSIVNVSCVERVIRKRQVFDIRYDRVNLKRVSLRAFECSLRRPKGDIRRYHACSAACEELGVHPRAGADDENVGAVEHDPVDTSPELLCKQPTMKARSAVRAL